jgi:hypothetical protein
VFTGIKVIRNESYDNARYDYEYGYVVSIDGSSVREVFVDVKNESVEQVLC